jgi:hypothetical protein
VPALFGLVFFNLNLAHVMHVSLSLTCMVVALAGAGFIVTVSSLSFLFTSALGVARGASPI